jgi:methionyl-tRNA formyltransferase
VRIVFMGTPQFAVEGLRNLHEQSNHEIVGVITATDKPAGRGQKIQFSAVKEYALKHNLKILQPEKLKAKSFLSELKNLHADLFVVVAFRMLPEVVWSMPEKGTINLHASLLPNYRGAAPINWAIINGEKETGVTTFFIEQKMDMGNIIDNRKVAIPPDMNAGELHDKLMRVGAELLLETVSAIEKGTCKSIPQSTLVNGELKEAFKIFKETCKIDWRASASTIHNLVRGLSPYPAAWAELSIDNVRTTVKIYTTSLIELKHKAMIGSVQTDYKNYLHVACGEGLIAIESLQLAGKSKVTCKEFLNGVKNKELHFY